MYDVGAIAKDVQQRFKLFASTRDGLAVEQNLATPANLRVLLVSLDAMSDELVAQRNALFLDFADDALPYWLPQWDSDMSKWRGRLGAYFDAVDAAVAAGHPDDREFGCDGSGAQCVLWAVTAPLLLGYYGGEASKLPQQPIDAVTPYMLANSIDVAEAWRQERLALLWDDLARGVRDVLEVGTSAAGALVTTAAIVVGAIVVWRMLR